MQRGAAFDVGLDVEDQLLHRRLVVAVADDLERLHQRNARGQHGRELAAEHRDVFGLDLAAGLERLRLLLDAAERAMPCRRRSARSAASSGARLLPLTRLPFLSMPSQVKGMSRLIVLRRMRCCCSCHACILRHSIVTLLTSSRLVMPCLTFSRPARRRSQTPSLAAWSLMSIGVAACHDDAADLFGDRHDLVDADAALVAVGAALAALGREDLDARADVRFLEAFLQQRFARECPSAPCTASTGVRARRCAMIRLTEVAMA